MLRAVERTHAAVVLVPDAEILQFREHRFAGRKKLAHMTPVHADKRNRAIAGYFRGTAERLLQERREGRLRHFSDRHRELAMPGLAQPGDVAVDRYVERWIGKHQIRLFAIEQLGVILRITSIA